MAKITDPITYKIIRHHERISKDGTTSVNRIYNFWKETWTETFQNLNIANTLDGDEFFRQSVVASIEDKAGEIIACHLYSFFDLEQQSTRNHSYFLKNISPNFFEIAKSRGIRSVMTIEYLGVSPQFRGKILGFSIPEALAHLGHLYAADNNIDALIASSRRDVGMTRLGERIGAEVVDDTFKVHNISTDTLIFPKKLITKSSDKLLSVVQELWKSRVEFCEVQEININLAA